ncbi:unnamed protein product [Lymnaea stagnalis]|uniref:C-type lectin domain-containing protein n=1 Tax=Lymnaea stagnalis TaxID=6523 RepID=A0AAV2IAJ5_LYMST
MGNSVCTTLIVTTKTTVNMDNGMLLNILWILYSLHIFVDGQDDIPICKEKGSRRVGELCFQFNSSLATWNQAKKNCESKGMTLAYVNSVNQIKEILENQPMFDRAWIGASDARKEGQFVWVASDENATELSLLWSRGEPNNMRRGREDEDCVNLFPSFYANDDPCSFNMSSICMEQLCPYNIKVERVFVDKVLLSWIPGFNGGPPQTFRIKYQDLETNVSRAAGTVTVPRVNQTSSSPFEYLLQGLSTGKQYKIYVDASIKNGKTACTPLVITTETTGTPDTQNRSIPYWLISVLISVPLVLASSIVTCFIYKRKGSS